MLNLNIFNFESRNTASNINSRTSITKKLKPQTPPRRSSVPQPVFQQKQKTLAKKLPTNVKVLRGRFDMISRHLEHAKSKLRSQYQPAPLPKQPSLITRETQPDIMLDQVSTEQDRVELKTERSVTPDRTTDLQSRDSRLAAFQFE